MKIVKMKPCYIFCKPGFLSTRWPFVKVPIEKPLGANERGTLACSLVEEEQTKCFWSKKSKTSKKAKNPKILNKTFELQVA